VDIDGTAHIPKAREWVHESNIFDFEHDARNKAIERNQELLEDFEQKATAIKLHLAELKSNIPPRQ